MPDRSTKHIPKKHAPIGATNKGKVKVLDGDTQRESWRQGTTGMSRDWDGDPVSTNYNKRDLKKQPHHSPRMRPEKRKVNMGDREGAYSEE